MAFSFSNWFKKPSTEEGNDTATATSEAPPAPAAAPAGPAAPKFPSAPPATRPVAIPAQGPVRTLKTVVPNSVRPVNLREGLARPGVNPIMPPSAASLRGPSAVPGGVKTRPISFPGMVPVSPSAAPAPAAPSPTAAALAQRNAASAALAFTPAPDAAVTVPLGEFFDRLPTNLLRAGAPVDRAREVVFQAGDLYSDLARGKASVPVSAVQAACPDLFNRAVDPTEDVEVALPLQRVIEQLASTFHARPDQVPEEDVAEIETPFLQVALEDSVRLPKPPGSVHPVARPTVAATPSAPPRKPQSKTSNITGNEAMTIRALTPRQAPTAPHAPAQAPAAPTPANPLTPPTRDTAIPINGVGKRPPSTVRASVAGGKIRLSGPAISSRSIAPAAAHTTPVPLAPSAPPVASKPVVLPPPSPAAPAAPGVPAQKKTARIQIPAIALRPAGAPAPAPAQPGRPAAAGVPPRSLSFPEPLVSFRATPGEGPGAAPAPLPSVAPRPAPSFPAAPPPMMAFAPVAFTPPPPAAPVMPPAAPAVNEDDGARITMALAPILRPLPEGLFADGMDGYAAAEQVPEGAKVELPLRFITTQLAQGRVAVPRAMFVEAMPPQCRHLMPLEGEPNEVLIPLQEVFQNLPTGALSRRQDQVVESIGPEIPTPFSQKAQEDAQRLAPPPADPEPEPAPEPAAELLEPEPATVVEPEMVEETAAFVAPLVEEQEAETPAVTDEQEEAPTLEIVAPEPAIEAEAPVVPVGEVEHQPEETAPELVQAKFEEPAALETESNQEEIIEPVKLEETPAVPAQIETEPVAVEPEPVVVPLAEEPVFQAPAVPDPAPEIAAEAAPLEEITPAAVVEEVEAPEPVAAESRPERELTPSPGAMDPAPALALPVSSNGQHAPSDTAAPGQTSAARHEEIQESLRAIFMVDDDLDAKKVVRLISELPGLKACAVMFGDGLKLAGELENGLSSSEGFCAMTPPFFRRARAYADELGLGETHCVSIQTERALLSLFMTDDICLSVQHAGNRSFLPGVREKLLAASAELARMYATPVSNPR